MKLPRRCPFASIDCSLPGYKVSKLPPSRPYLLLPSVCVPSPIMFDLFLLDLSTPSLDLSQYPSRASYPSNMSDTTTDIPAPEPEQAPDGSRSPFSMAATRLNTAAHQQQKRTCTCTPESSSQISAALDSDGILRTLQRYHVALNLESEVNRKERAVMETSSPSSSS